MRRWRGIAGTAALRGQTLNIGDAQDCEFAEDVEGTDDIEESIVAVPMRFERSTIGVIVLSKLGKNQFSTLSVRLLELLAAQAAVAFESARLLEAERQSAAVSKACSRSPPARRPSRQRPASPSTSPTACGCWSTRRRSPSSPTTTATAGDRLERRLTVAPSLCPCSTPAIPPEARSGSFAWHLPALSVEAAGVASHAVAAPLHSGLLVVLADSPPTPPCARSSPSPARPPSHSATPSSSPAPTPPSGYATTGSDPFVARGLPNDRSSIGQMTVWLPERDRVGWGARFAASPIDRRSIRQMAQPRRQPLLTSTVPTKPGKVDYASSVAARVEHRASSSTPRPWSSPSGCWSTARRRRS